MTNRIGIGIAVAAACILAVAVMLGLTSVSNDSQPQDNSSPSLVDKDNSGESTQLNTGESNNSSDSEERERRPRFVRAEDAGENFTKLDSSEIVRRLGGSENRIERRKAAKVLGDRDLAGTLTITQDEQAALGTYIDKTVTLTAASVGQDRAEANDQIRRLWRLTADTLIDNLGNENRTIVEAAAKNLALMRNADIVDKIIARIKATDDVKFKRGAVLTLGVMREKRDCLVPGRNTLNDEKSQALAAKVIVPFLKELQSKEKDPETLKLIEEINGDRHQFMIG